MRDKVKKILSNAESKQIVHEAFSGGCFNKCWTLIEKTDRSPENVEDMLLLAQASLWHWKQRNDCNPVNLSVAYWQVSRVYALAGHYDQARLFGDKCLKVSKDNNLSPFYIGYAYEAQARAEVLNKDFKAAGSCIEKAEMELAGVTDKDEKGFLETDIVELKRTLQQLGT
jgi:tetratricopeptide (TPR) repeat protein